MPPEHPVSGPVPHSSSVPVFILCGGLGSRLRAVECRPKAIIPLAGVPFLTYTLRLLRLQGFERICLLLGIGAEQVQTALSDQGLTFSLEATPLGTGGALALVRDQAGPVNLILNGDSYAESIYPDLVAEHHQRGPEAFDGLSLLAVWQDDCADYGALEIDLEGRVLAFREKGARGPGWINAGVYATGGGFFATLPAGAFSLEKEVMPELARQGRLWALRQKCFFRDIGTPQRLALAREEFRWIHRRFSEAAGDKPGA